MYFQFVLSFNLSRDFREHYVPLISFPVIYVIGNGTIL